MSEDTHVVFWYFDGAAGDHHYETFESKADAMEALASYAVRYPYNTYYIARVIGVQPASCERPKDLYWKGLTVAPIASNQVCEAIVKDGVITAITITNIKPVS
jgi:hypothetical protein